MGIADELRRARKDSGLQQRKVEELTGIRQEHVSRIERGMRNTSLASLDELAEAYGVRWVAAPRKVADESEIAMLQPDLRDLILRLVRVLPLLPPELLEDLKDRADNWDRRYLSEDAIAPSSQVTRANVS